MSDRRFYIKKNRDDSILILKQLIELLDNNNIKYYLDFGTLLGAVRNSGFITWDDDIDITLFNSDDAVLLSKLIESLKTKYSYRIYKLTFLNSKKARIKNKDKIYNDKYYFTNENNLQIIKVRNNRFWKFGRGNVNIDIFVKYNYNDYLYWVADGKIHKINDNTIKEGLIKISFYGIDCYILKEYDRYLTTIYGNWKLEQKNWDESMSLSFDK